jgi:hypothetical protein
MRTRSLPVKLLLLAAFSIALVLGGSAAAGAQEYDDPGDYDGYDYGGPDDTVVTTTTQAPPPVVDETPSDPGLPRTGGVAMLGLAAGVAVTGLAIRRLATSS